MFAQLTNEFSDTVSLRMTGYYTKRDQTLTVFPREVTSAGSGITNAAWLTAAYPAALLIGPCSTFTVPEGTGFSLAPNAAYRSTPNEVGFETWGVTPELTFKLGSDWQVRTTAHFGRSFNDQSFPGINAPLAQCYITGCTAATSPSGAAIEAGQLNPFNVGTASASVISDLIDYESAQQTKQQMFVTRIFGDGPLFALPGGTAKLAIGVEYQDNQADSRLTSGRVNSVEGLAYNSYGRHSYSMFGELSLPITSFLDLSASVRYDHYSDFGSTTNPNFGATLHPTDWLKVYGHWNTSFNAPTAVDGLGIGVGRFPCGIYTVGLGSASRPYDPAPVQDNGQGTCGLVLDGVKAEIGPMTAHSWAVGFEATPINGLSFGGEFYSIDFRNVLGAVNPQNLNTYLTNPDLYIYAVTAPQYAALLAQLTNGTTLTAQQPSSNIALVVDRRASNICNATLEGIDFHIYYDADVGSGRLSLGLAGTKTTKSNANFGAPTNELGNVGPELTFTFFTGYKVGGFSTRLTTNYSGKYHDTSPNVSGLLAGPIQPFTTVNLNFGYDFEGGILDGTSLRLSIDNLFEQKPQRTPRGSANLITYANYTLGRVIKLGFSKKF